MGSRRESNVARLIREHPVGTVPEKRTFETKEDIDDYIDRTQAENAPRLRELKRMREEGYARNRHKPVGSRA